MSLNISSNVNNNTTKTDKVVLRLGDIIEIQAPSNPEIHKLYYYITYIDNLKIVLIDIKNKISLVLTINQETNSFDDESIQKIVLVYRNPELGYARQNNLLPNTWVNIYFGGDQPIIVTGLITNLEEDMIELKTYPNNKYIYIDFKYQGIPEELLITKIEIRDEPEKIASDKQTEAIENKDIIPVDVNSVVQVDNIEDLLEEASENVSQEKIDENVLDSSIIENEVKNNIQKQLIEADNIVFGENLKPIVEVYEVSDKEKIFSIEKQTHDLMNDLISKIPDNKRTTEVMNRIKLIIQRYTELRSAFSKIDENNVVYDKKVKGSKYIPIVQNLLKSEYNINWVVPVVNIKKKIYNLSNINDQDNILDDIIPVQQGLEMSDFMEFMNSYKNNRVPNTQFNYSSYISEINNSIKPYENLDENQNKSLYSGIVNSNTTAIINNDVYNTFTSSVAKLVQNDEDSFLNIGIDNKKYSTIRFLTGENTLETKKYNNEIGFLRKKIVKKPLLDSELLQLNSILFLPKKYILDQKTHNKYSNILNKSLFEPISNILQYNLLENKMYVPETIEINDDKDRKTVSELLSNKNNLYNFVSDKKLSSKEDYKNFLNKVFPSTREIIEYIREFKSKSYNTEHFVKQMENFLIHYDDITFKQYELIKDNIESNVSNYTVEFLNKKRDFYLWTNNKYVDNTLFNDNNINIYYDHTIDKTKNLISESEFLNNVMIKDNFKYYILNDLKNNINNYFHSFNTISKKDIEDFQKSIENNDKKIEKSKENKKCLNYVIAKKYIELDELEEDNDKIIYFDKNYDKTIYDIIDEYKNEKTEMDTDSFKLFLKGKLMENIGLDEYEAEYDAQSMIDGKRTVRNGQYAILESINDEDKSVFTYYIRKGGKWVLDKNVTGEQFGIDDNELFCNLQKGCVNSNDSCVSVEKNENEIIKENLEKFANEFEKQYYIDHNRFVEHIEHQIKMSKIILNNYHDDNYFSSIKQFTHLYTSEDIEKDKQKLISPHIKLRNMILGEQNLVKRYNYILKFVNRFCTEPYSSDIKENPDNAYWLYCIDTKTKLLPEFYMRLAESFIQNQELNINNYLQEVFSICKEQGEKSEDGNAWVDKYSGYVIQPIYFDIDEGYTEDGFKKISREIMERDMGEIVLNNNKNMKSLFTGKDQIKIINILNTMTGYIGMKLNSKYEFIIKHTTDVLSKIVRPKEEYDEYVKIMREKGKGKKIQSYEDNYNSFLILVTLCFIVVAIQTSIPSLKTRKTYPHCKRSFSGYPLYGNDDTSFLKYVSCIAYKIKSSIKPWNSIRKLKAEKIQTQMKFILDNYINKTNEIKTLYTKKREYNALNPDNEFIPKEHDITKWKTFLPPLKKIKSDVIPDNITESFANNFKKTLKSGHRKQYEQLNTVKGMIIKFSVYISGLINNIVKKETNILSNSANEPYIENNCCLKNLKKLNTLHYFSKKDDNIIKYNSLTKNLSKIVNDLNKVTTAPLLYYDENTKLLYPSLSNDFSEETIYLSVFQYCNFNNLIPIPEDLMPICIEKPHYYDKNDSLKERIEKLKNNGKSFTTETLNNLLNIVNKDNIVTIKYNNNKYDIVENLNDILLSDDNKNNELNDTFNEMFLKYINSSKEDDIKNNGRQFRNYLFETSTQYKREIFEFIRENSKTTKKELASIKNLLENIIKFPKPESNMEFIYNMSHEEFALHKGIEFLKNSIRNISVVFPSIVKNNVDFTKINIPKHWKLSKKHQQDIKNLFGKHYQLDFNNADNNIINVCEKVIQKNRLINKLINNITLFGTDMQKESLHTLFNNRTTQMLFEFYMIYTIYTYVQSSHSEKNINDDEEIEIGNLETVKKSTAKFLKSCLMIIKNNKKDINYTHLDIKNLVTRTKTKEKDIIVDYLTDLTDEERNIENIMKNNKLGNWNLGMQKGLREYVKDTYDMERNKMEQQMINDFKLGKDDVVNDMNRNIFEFDLMEKEQQNMEIDRENYDMSWIPDEENENDSDIYN